MRINLNCYESRQAAAPAGLTPALSPVRVLRPVAWACPVRGSSTRHRNDRGMRPQWRCPGSRIEYRIARPRVDSGRGGPECVVHRSEEHTSELQSHLNLVCRLLLEKKKKQTTRVTRYNA